MTKRAMLIGVLAGAGALAGAGLAAPLAAQSQRPSALDSIMGQLIGPKPAATPAATPTPAPASTLAPSVTNGEAVSGLKLSLDKAAETVVGQLGKPGGFANDPKVRIGLPGPLGRLNGLLGVLDGAGVTDGLSNKLNAAAEGAVGKALPLMKTAITQMTVTDAVGIITGGQTSATDYFKRTMGPQLQTEMNPLVSKSLSNVKAFAALSSFTAKNRIPVGQFGTKDLTGYVTQKASDGVFYYLGEQERAIRANPLGTGSTLIAKIFGPK